MRPDADEGEKRTNEIGTIVPLLETLPDIAGLPAGPRERTAQRLTRRARVRGWELPVIAIGSTFLRGRIMPLSRASSSSRERGRNWSTSLEYQ